MVNIRQIIESVDSLGLNEGILNESSFSASKLLKVSTLLGQVLGHQLGGEFKLLGGSLGKESFKKKGLGEGQGYKFMNKKGAMLRFGWLKKAKKSNYQINVVDYWDPKDGKKRWDTPTTTVRLADWLNVVDVVQELKTVLVQGSANSINLELQESVSESVLSLSEAATTNGKLLAYASAKGVEFEGESTSMLKKKLANAGAWDEDEYRGYSVTTNQKENNSTEAVFKGAEKKLAEKKWSDPELVFGDIENLTRIVATGGANGLIVAGMAGMGKTFHVEKTMKELLGSPEGADAKWRHRKGAKLSPFGLYMDLFMNRSGMTLVYDDSDSVWNDKDSVNILKSAIDTYKVRQVAWPSKSTVNLELMGAEEKAEYLEKLYKAMVETPEDVGVKIKLPSSFDFTSRIIFISNMPAAKFDKDPNMSAIKSRSFFMDIQLKREDVINRIRSILPFIEPEVEMSVKLEILDQLSESDSALTMRAVVAAIAIKKAGLSDWQRLVQEYA